MKIQIKRFGTVLVSRPAGKEALAALKSFKQDLSNEDKLELDFAGVSVLTPSWADEFITPLKKEFPRKVVLKNITNPSVIATLGTLEKVAKHDIMKKIK